MKIKTNEDYVYQGKPITVRDLIKALQQCSPYAVVKVHDITADEPVVAVKESGATSWSDGTVSLWTW